MITDTGMRFALMGFHTDRTDSNVFLDDQIFNSYQLNNNDTIKIQGNAIYTGVPRENTGYFDELYPELEYAIKSNTSGYIATIKNIDYRRNIVLPINKDSCHVLWNGINPTGWDNRLLINEKNVYRDLTRPNLIELYPQLGIREFAHQSYEIYYDTTNGFWKELVYAEEIIDE